MNRFNDLLHNYSNYRPVEMWRVQLLDTIQPIPINEKHIQFLYSPLLRDNVNENWLLYGRGHGYVAITMEKIYLFMIL